MQVRDCLLAVNLQVAKQHPDTFTAEDLMRCAGWCLTDFKGPQHIYIGLRDRAMLLTSCSVAFRGDSTRNLLLSDLFATDVVFNAKGLGEVVPVRICPPYFSHLMHISGSCDYSG
jgi:hypothetical protein